jgi:fructose-bisphosphate aldolase, class I
MNTGKLVRLNRLFGHSSGRLCSIAVDHFSVYPEGLPEPLRAMAETVKAVVKARPDAVTMHIGPATMIWKSHAGAVPLILQSSMIRPDDSSLALATTPEDAVRLGADAYAVVAFVRGKTEGHYLQRVADCVRQAARFEMPVILHVYPRIFTGDSVAISYEPEDIAWAAHCGVELGVDVIKVPYCGDTAAYARIVAQSPVPVVAAGGPKTKDLRGALSLMAEVVKSGAAGATIGRNAWGFDPIGASIKAFKAVIHDGLGPDDALRKAGL